LRHRMKSLKKGWMKKTPEVLSTPRRCPRIFRRKYENRSSNHNPVQVRTKTVRFEDNPVMIPLPSKGPDQYHICRDLMDRKADVTFGQLLHDNVNYKRQVVAEFGRK
jgi:hypothetical protein